MSDILAMLENPFHNVKSSVEVWNIFYGSGVVIRGTYVAVCQQESHL